MRFLKQCSSDSTRRIRSTVILSLFAIFTLPICTSTRQPQGASTPDYHRYIDPLITVKDFGMHYYEDGAADASVLFPEGVNYPRPAEPVIALVRLRGKVLSLLIDCLNDGRITSIRFDGNRRTSSMNVPVGYVCLDILMNTTRGKPVSDPECADDGLGACMNFGFYFRPDDYYECSDSACLSRPWISVVQRNWKKQFLANRLRFRNPYDDLKVEEYKDLETKAR